jgi:signal transduction histidine kinase/DNA-binding response OmpR family regulator
LIVVALTATLNYVLNSPLEKALEQRELNALDQLRDSYANEIDSQLTSIDVAIEALASTAASDRYTAREKHLLLNQTAQALTSVRVIGIVDQTGMVEHSSRTFPAPEVDLSGRDYIDYFLDGGEAKRFLSGPVRNAVDNRWQISLSRPIRDTDGNLTGVISSVIDPGTLVEQISRASADGDRFSLLDQDGNLISEFPGRDDLVGSALNNSASYQDLVSLGTGEVSRLYREQLRDDTVFSSLKRTFDDELILTISRPYDSAMSYWGTISALISLASIVLAAFVCWTVYILHKRALGMQTKNAELSSANAQITLEREKAEKLARIKEDFLANMSHEIRTPMNAIAGLAQLLERCDLRPAESEYVRQIKLSGKFLLGIIEEILTFSKMETGGVTVHQEPYRLSDIIDNVGSMLSVAMEDKNIDVVIDVDPELPDVIVGDAQKTKQVLVNLASNAIKFTHEGSVRLSAKPLHRPDGIDQMIIEVRDTGIGIAPSKLDSIFDAFNQADNSSIRQHGGTGLGLAISKRLVESLGGAMEVTSEEGYGSTFRVTLPCQPGSDVRTKSTTHSAHHGIHVLIVDDHTATLEALSTMAAESGLTVDTANSGKEALASIKRQNTLKMPYDAILIDWQMPGMDGIEVIQTLEQDHELESLPAIVMVTAYQREMIEKTGANKPRIFDILSKPVTGSTLRNVVDAAIRNTSPAQSDPDTAFDIQPDILRDVSILVAEDNQMNQQVARELLTSVGAHVEIVSNGVDVLSALKAKPYDLVLMDVQMPVMDGIEATKLIKDIPDFVDLPIIALTAGVLDSERRKCAEAGMVGFIGKPFDFDIVVSKIRDTLGMETPQTINTAHQEGTTLSSELPLWDRKRALLLAGGKEHLLKRLALLYPNQIREQLVQVIDAINNQDADTAAKLLHSMQGSSSQIAAQRAAALGKELENQARENGMEGLSARFDGFPEIIENTAKLIEHEFATEAVPSDQGQTDLSDLSKLMGLLESGNAEAISEFQNQKEQLNSVCSPVEMSEIEANMRRLEFAAVLEMLRSLQQRIE